MKIGNLTLDNNLFLAPMAGITHCVFRGIVREVGGVAGFTEMVSAEGLVRNIERTRKYIEPFPGETPHVVQLFGADPGALAAAALMAVESGADMIDINMGCPVKKVLKAGAGAALMKERKKTAVLLRRVRDALSCPLSIKIRSGWSADEILAPDIARTAQDSGVDAIVVHPRTVVQGFSGQADWEVIRHVRNSVQIPVIGNGDVRTSQDALRMVRETDCTGIMVGRGALGNPWIFREIQYHRDESPLIASPALAEKEAVICRHLDRNVRFFGEKTGVKDFYRHLVWYTRGMRDCTSLRKQVLGLESPQDVEAVIHCFFSSLPPPSPSDGKM